MQRKGVGCFVGFLGIMATTAAAFGQCPACSPTDGAAAASYARPSDTGRYIGYSVGGGSAFAGDAPAWSEGVWGWDYSGAWLRPRIALWWNHGRRYQGGLGAYHTDGPRFVQEHREKKGD
jgi:hypothetical protein